MDFRENSSVAPRRDEFGELVFGSDCNGPVIHRTPEELGLARVVKDAMPPRQVSTWVEREERPARPIVKKDAARKNTPVVPSAVTTERRRAMSNGTIPAAVSADKRRLNSVPSKRYGKPAIGVVTMQDVPEPPPRNGSIAEELYVQIAALKPGTAVKVAFESEQHGDYVRSKLRGKAKKDGRFMASSRTLDGKTRYFWLEKL